MSFNHTSDCAEKPSPFSAPLSRFHKTALCATLLLGGVYGTMRIAYAQAAPESLQTRPGGTQNVHELSLLANAHYGNLNAVESALSRGADVNAQDADGQTALMLAADYDSARTGRVSDEFKRLREASGVSGYISGSSSAIFWNLNSAADLDSEPARYLLKEGAVQRLDPATGRPILEWRSTNNNADVLQALIRQGADVNRRDRRGRTALIHAASNANTTALRLLLQNKADINARDHAGLTALGYAAYNANDANVQALKAGGAILDAHSADGPLLLRYAVSRRDSAQLRSLTAPEAGVSAEGIQSALTTAVSSSNAEAVERLVQRGANVNATGSWAPMGTSFFSHNERMTELLLRLGADPNGMGSYGESYFLEAARMGSPQLVQAFVDRGADVNARDQQGSTPLFLAMLGIGGIFRSDPDDAPAGKNALAGDTRQTGALTVAKMLLAKGADVNAANKNGETPLLMAVKLREVEAARYLIEHGANVNVKTVHGVTPLSWAIRYHNNAAADVLRAAGAKE